MCGISVGVRVYVCVMSLSLPRSLKHSTHFYRCIIVELVSRGVQNMCGFFVFHQNWNSMRSRRLLFLLIWLTTTNSTFNGIFTYGFCLHSMHSISIGIRRMRFYLPFLLCIYLKCLKDCFCLAISRLTSHFLKLFDCY